MSLLLQSCLLAQSFQHLADALLTVLPEPSNKASLFGQIISFGQPDGQNLGGRLVIFWVARWANLGDQMREFWAARRVSFGKNKFVSLFLQTIQCFVWDSGVFAVLFFIPISSF